MLHPLSLAQVMHAAHAEPVTFAVSVPGKEAGNTAPLYSQRTCPLKAWISLSLSDKVAACSGFTLRSESEYDPFGAGHSSTSISSALGMAVARDFKVGFSTYMSLGNFADCFRVPVQATTADGTEAWLELFTVLLLVSSVWFGMHG